MAIAEKQATFEAPGRPGSPVELDERYDNFIDVHLGDIGGAAVYIDADQYERWRRPDFLIDVAPGAAESFSLEGLEGVHFVARDGAYESCETRCP